MNGAEDSCGRRGKTHLKILTSGQPAEAAEDRLGTKDVSPPAVRLGEEGRERLAI
jgi:hypothetical protein